jgi:hypothetical protein
LIINIINFKESKQIAKNVFVDYKLSVEVCPSIKKGGAQKIEQVVDNTKNNTI